jgi:tetratricopeptide (TPR) repeat protein
MPALFILDVETDAATRRATLRLQDGDGVHLGAQVVTLDDPRPALWSALFDTRRHVAAFRDVEAPEAQLAAIGRFLGDHVLGPVIAGKLAEGKDRRTLLVRLPDPAHDALAAAFARVPWELARAPGGGETLLARNVAVRVAPAGARPGREAALALGKDEAVRVLLVFAEAPGSDPLAVRLERERLRALFFDEVLPQRRVEVDVLCHDVTRRSLRAQVRARGGYHVVHWSGHGHAGALEIGLDEEEGAPPRVSGEELVGLFVQAGGFIPPVVFLSACHSGALAGPGNGDRAEGDAAGLAGTALSLARAGVKQVVAMRDRVGDRYARRLARRFYRRLLADGAHHAADEALALARRELAEDEARRAQYDAVDHATPLVLGAESVRIEPRAARSPQMDRQKPRPQPLLTSGSRELDPPYGFVGRGEELTRLSRGWLAAEGAAAALVQGLAGLGKTSLAAEAVNLWFDRFDYVFCFQAKGGPLSIEDFYVRLHQRLTLASPAYRARCKENELARLYVAPGPDLTGQERHEALRNNLIDALESERVLLVIDNFETNLLPHGGPDHTCQDPAWDALLEALGDRLRGSGSRLLMTSRHKPAALAKRGLWIPLGPLPPDEARLFFEGQPPLRGLRIGDDEGKRLARRILQVSRGHPLILARIADLARPHHDKKTDGLTAAGRAALSEALDKITGRGFEAVPDAFAGTRTDEERERERAYLEDVAVGAVDLLIGRLGPEARALLWIVTRAGEPVPGDMIAAVLGESPSMRLGELCGSGLLVREGEAYAFHELVAERAAAWMEKHADERMGHTEASVWRAYGTRYGALFKELRAGAKRDQASEAGRRGIRYLVRARAFDALGAFAGDVVTGTRDPALLGAIVADLQVAVAEAPAGEARWRLRTTLADALNQGGRPDQALPLYAQAAEEAKAAEHWSDLGWIYQNWASALRAVGQLDRAHETYLASAAAQTRAGRPRVDVLGSELEALRVDVMQGRAEQALPAVEARLGEVRAFRAQAQQGTPVPEAPDREALARALVSGLDIAEDVNRALGRWQPCLDLLGEIEQAQRALGAGEHDLTVTRFNRYYPLVRLGKLPEARAVLEGCLDVFRRLGDVTNEARALSALADVWNALGDPAQAAAVERRALAVCDTLPDPGDRAASHNNLALYLHATGEAEEAGAHQLAAIAYRLVTGIDLRLSTPQLAHRIRESAARGETFTLPPLAALLAAPPFAALRAFLAERAVPVPDLQARIDAFVADTRAAVAAGPPPSPPPA